MIHAQYVGPVLQFRGRTALVRENPMNPDEVLVQFDFPVGTEFDHKGTPLGSLEPIAHLTSRDMVPKFPDEHPECFQWRVFPAEHFVDTSQITAGSVVALES